MVCFLSAFKTLDDVWTGRWAHHKRLRKDTLVKKNKAVLVSVLKLVL